MKPDAVAAHFDLTDRIILVTGGSRGLGFEMSRAFAQAGATVAPTAGEIPYATAKAGLNNLTAGLARTFAPKVRSNWIMPGPFLTDISEAWTEEVKAASGQFQCAVPTYASGGAGNGHVLSQHVISV